MTDIVIVSAARTAVGAFSGAFATTPAHELGKAAIVAALQRAKLDPKEVSEVVLGHVLTAGLGMNPARQASRAAGVPDEAPAWGLNQVCGSGLRAVAVGCQQIKAATRIIVAGGQENMTLAQHAGYLRAGQKMGALEFQGHDDHRRADRCVQPISHGRHRRERGREISDQPRPAG